MKKVIIKTAVPYEAVIGAGLLEDSQCLSEIPGSELMLVTDSTVAELYLGDVRRRLESTGRRVGVAVFPAGEENKTLATVETMLAAFAEFGLTRGGAVVALGGGVAGDMAGFASAIWLRGIPVVQMPTTLLAMVDSSVGGKTGVDLPYGKNLIGAFHQPSLVLADTTVLQTLPHPRRLEGLAEMVKAGVIADSTLFARLASSPDAALNEDAISRCVEIKADIVAADSQEHGIRKQLNLGHTAGHAIELASGFEISHGAAVAMGMVMAARAGAAIGMTSCDCRDAIIKTLKDCGLPTESPYPLECLMDGMLKDKKRLGATLTVVVPCEIGRCELLRLPVDDVADFWRGAWKDGDDAVGKQ